MKRRKPKRRKSKLSELIYILEQVKKKIKLSPQEMWGYKIIKNSDEIKNEEDFNNFLNYVYGNTGEYDISKIFFGGLGQYRRDFITKFIGQKNAHVVCSPYDDEDKSGYYIFEMFKKIIKKFEKNIVESKRVKYKYWDPVKTVISLFEKYIIGNFQIVAIDNNEFFITKING